jgi:hypothetical protein
MRHSTVISLVSLLAGGIQCLAQGIGNGCTPAGTWYGGKENGAKYLLTITPSGVRWTATPFPRLTTVYTVVYQAAFEFKPRVQVLTRYTGEMVSEGWTNFRGQIIAMVNQSDQPPGPDSPANSPEVWAIRERGSMVDCNTMKFEIDFFAVYLWASNKVPFQDPPDSSRLAPGAVSQETYRRMATECAQCPSGN